MLNIVSGETSVKDYIVTHAFFPAFSTSKQEQHNCMYAIAAMIVSIFLEFIYSTYLPIFYFVANQNIEIQLNYHQMSMYRNVNIIHNNLSMPDAD